MSHLGRGGGGGGVERGGGGQNFLLERADKSEMRGGGRGHFFITLQFNYIYCVWGESMVPFIHFWIFGPLS